MFMKKSKARDIGKFDPSLGGGQGALRLLLRRFPSLSEVPVRERYDECPPPDLTPESFLEFRIDEDEVESFRYC